MSAKKPLQKVNPRSLANLKPGSEPEYGEVKKRRTIAVTDTSYQGLQELANHCGCSVSEYLERLGRGIIGDSNPNKFSASS
jgi:hypothetical protein